MSTVTSAARGVLLLKTDDLSVVDEAVDDGVGDGRVTDEIRPHRRGELRCDDRRTNAVAVLENLKQPATFFVSEGVEAEVIEQEHVVAHDVFQHPGVRMVELGLAQQPE